jgi:hypothetical protein|tara:strand:- start:217 stop:828 length:612 start_codon:yes stop_codon:yes gene_type:complete
MAKSKSLPTQVELKAQVATLVAEDKAISKAEKAKTTKLVLNKDSFYLRLASTVSKILKLENSNILTKELKSKYNLVKIDRRRLSEAMWLFNNYDKVVAWLKATRKRYENISSLQKAFNKANKPKASDETKSQDEPKVQETESKTQDSPKSDTTEPKAQNKKLTASEVALEVLVQLEMNNISIKDFARELNSQYKQNKELDKVA